jgi:two-component system heavy metal sensor histidine kinase CusS
MKGIASDNLDVRIVLSELPVERHPLAASFNEMLDQLQASFARLRDFSADIAHELRTPVTNLTTETQVALSKARGVAAYQDVLYSNLEELERMGKPR